MGQQQLLLLVLAAIIVGVGVLVGVNMFQENAAQANFDAVRQDCLTFASAAQAWAKRPVAMGGGGQNFTAFDWPSINRTPAGGPFVNENGSYAITAGGVTSVTITGTGKESLDGDATPLSVTVVVTTNGVTVTQAD
jgi:hypothetical protein